MLLPLAAVTHARPQWPDPVDLVAMAVVAGVLLGLPLLGYVCMAVDFRRYLRSLRRALVVVVRAAPNVPYWTLRDRPPCLEALSLAYPCTEQDVAEAYRREVKRLHPDLGGDLQEFLRLQKHFEQALHLVRQRQQRRR